jgi:hypothetical protein
VGDSQNTGPQVQNNCKPPPFPPIESIKDSTHELYLTVINHNGAESSDSSSVSSVSSEGSEPTTSRIKDAVKKERRSINVEADVQKFEGAGQRRSYFSSAKKRQVIQFGPEVCTINGSSQVHVMKRTSTKKRIIY